MQPDFWKERWARREIGFHLPMVNPVLKRHAGIWGGLQGKRVLVPLCGKTEDMAWLREQGAEVIGAELAGEALREFAETHGLALESHPDAGLICHQAPGYRLYEGDFFALTPEQLGPIDAVYDRAALVALPVPMREPYARQLMRLAPQARQLLVTLDYDQQQMSGPPFAVSPQEVESLYAAHYRISALESMDVIDSEPRFRDRGLSSFVQAAWELRPR